MDTNTKNLNQEVQTLITMLQNEAETKGTEGEMLFVPQTISSAQLIASNHTLSEEELNYSQEAEEKATLSNTLSDFQRKVSKAYDFEYSGEDKPEWLKISGKKYEDFFPTFFTSLESDAKLMTFLEHNNVDISAAQESFAARSIIIEHEAQKSQIFRKIERMIDLKGLLIHALRMYNLSTFEIKAQLV